MNIYRFTRLIVVGLASGLLFFTLTISASQFDIVGPAGSGSFGTGVFVLPNGNIVVTDPFYSEPGLQGAVYLYRGSDLAIISVLKGEGFATGSGIGIAVTVLTNGNFVVSSPYWDSTAGQDVGAVTFCKGSTGCNGIVSASNSLVGGSAHDNVGFFVTALTNGNYVVSSPNWASLNGGNVANAGAVTWCSGTSGSVGLVTSSNSLIGGTVLDSVGYSGNGSGVVALTNGNYVVGSSNWTNPVGPVSRAGAVTWCNGNGSTIGLVSATNSLVGGTTGDVFSGGGNLTPLPNGNYVLVSRAWDNPTGPITDAGAVTWGNGLGGTSGIISPSNSLIGGTSSDFLGTKVAPLTNGNYVVGSPYWNNPAGNVLDAGAVTWCSGMGTTSAQVSATNSLVGNSIQDFVGIHVIALTNGNYVTSSGLWSSSNQGAATWGNGFGGTVGMILQTNSIIGRAGDSVGDVLVPLTNGNFVVGSPAWDDPAHPTVQNPGASTWVHGDTGSSETVSANGSIIGGSVNDEVGFLITPLANGNYVLGSPFWTNTEPNPDLSSVGAATWCDGSDIITSQVGPAASFIGSGRLDNVGSAIVALKNGNYVIISRNNANATGAPNPTGAATVGNGFGGTAGMLSPSNSLVGTTFGDFSSNSVVPLQNGNFLLITPYFDNPSGPVTDSGAVSYVQGTPGATVGPISTANSVLGTLVGEGSTFTPSYDSIRNRVFLGRKQSNKVSVLYFSATAITSGVFSDPATWGGTVPDAYTNAVIPNDVTVTLTAPTTVGSISVGCTGRIEGGSPSAYIVGNVSKDFCGSNGETFTYPLGDPSNYSPLTASNVTGTGTLLAGVTDATLPGLSSAASVSRFWSLSGYGITTDLAFNYTDGDVSGIESQYLMYKISGGVLSEVSPSIVDPVANTIQVTGISTFSDWGVGNEARPTAAGVTVSGRVLASKELGLANARVTLTDSSGAAHSVITNLVGNYSFTQVLAGEGYIISVKSKGLSFEPRVVIVKGNVTGFDFLPSN